MRGAAHTAHGCVALSEVHARTRRVGIGYTCPIYGVYYKRSGPPPDPDRAGYSYIGPSRGAERRISLLVLATFVLCVRVCICARAAAMSDVCLDASPSTCARMRVRAQHVHLPGMSMILRDIAVILRIGERVTRGV